MQDVTATATSDDGAEFFGVFDGHLSWGYQIARLSSEVVQEVATMQFEPSQDVFDRAGRVKECLHNINVSLLDMGVRFEGGSTATVGVFKENELAVAYLGDSEAFFYPDEADAIALIKPHTVNNRNEVQRLRDSGVGVSGKYFINQAGYISVSRAMGDFHYGFVGSDAEITGPTLLSPGTLLIASDGVWGHFYSDIEEIVRNMPESTQDLADRLVQEFAFKNKDNASAIVARVE